MFRNCHLFRGLQLAIRNEWGFQPMRCCEGENVRVLFRLFYPFKQTYFVCYQLSFHVQRDRRKTQMIPEGGESSTNTTKTSEIDDGSLAGYKECATEALNWLLNLGYQPGHPLIRSLAAHLTKKQAYLEKLNLERFLIDETFKNSMEIYDEDGEVDPYVANSVYENCALTIQNDKDIQKALVDAVFKGCDLKYCKDQP